MTVMIRCIECILAMLDRYITSEDDIRYPGHTKFEHRLYSTTQLALA